MVKMAVMGGQGPGGPGRGRQEPKERSGSAGQAHGVGIWRDSSRQAGGLMHVTGDRGRAPLRRPCWPPRMILAWPGGTGPLPGSQTGTC